METDLPLSTPVTSSSAFDVIDEMADRDRRKNNIVVYKFPESADRKTDIKSFKACCNTVFKSDVDLSKAICLSRAKNC